MSSLKSRPHFPASVLHERKGLTSSINYARIKRIFKFTNLQSHSVGLFILTIGCSPNYIKLLDRYDSISWPARNQGPALTGAGWGLVAVGDSELIHVASISV